MLNNIQMTCFRQHRDKSILFAPGLNVVRGANEAGKSTLIEAISYALYGASSLRNSLASTVTWGEKESALKVTLNLTVEGKAYTFCRSKSGAEVRVDGKPYVTGQKEVSSFAEQLLGANANTAVKLMLSRQNGLRGALEQGPKATAEMIETLADFDVFERILQAAETKLTLGSTVALDTQITGARLQLDALSVPLAPMPEPELMAKVVAMQAELDQLDGIAKEKEKLAEAARKAATAERARAVERRELNGRIDSLEAGLPTIKAQIATKGALAGRQRVPLQDLEQAVEMAKTAEARGKARKAFISLPDVDERMEVAEFDKEDDELSTSISQNKASLRTMELDLATAKAGLVTSSVCGFCGQDVSQFPEAAKKNAELTARVESLTASINKVTEVLQWQEQRVKDMVAMAQIDKRIRTIVSSHSAYMKAVGTAIPTVVQWVGGEESEGLDLASATAALEQAKRHNAEADRAAVEVETLSGVLERTEHSISEIRAKVAAFGEQPDAVLLDLETKEGNTGSEWGSALAAASAAKSAMEAFKEEQKALNTAWNNFQSDVKSINARIEDLEKAVEETQFNNSLVKKIRAARPLVSNKLWNLVLASVGTIFSAIRGERSVVARTKDGFTVNGQEVDSLSGSALDILGLSIRVALVKTFLPACPLLVLDEPSAACDDDRTQLLLGFVASVGFQQTLMVTHESQSESFAANLIEL